MTDGIWTLYIDESGRFEDTAVPGESAEALGRVIGGVLCPGTHDAIEAGLRPQLEEIAAREHLALPWHAHEISPPVAARILRGANGLVKALGGDWLFVVDDRPGSSDGDPLVNYVRLLGALVDLAVRLLAARGAHSFEVICAQRTVPIAPEHVGAAKEAGMAVRNRPSGPFLDPVVEAEVRGAVDAIRHQGSGALPRWPELRRTRRETATGPNASCGVLLADLGTNRARQALRSSTSATPEPVLAAPLTALSDIRRLDHALRDRQADLVSAGHVVRRLEHEAGAPDIAVERRFGARGAARIARALWDNGIARLGVSEKSARPVAVMLAAHAGPELALKTGNYEGTWLALEAGWLGDSALAQATRRALARDRQLAALLWRLSLECANHRGDVDTAERAASAVETLVAQSPSVALLAEASNVLNLRNVSQQNRLLGPPGETADLVATMRSAADGLIAHSRRIAEVLAILRGAACEVPSRPSSEPETVLWRALTGADPAWAFPDVELGKAYGTAARSLAFAGELSAALQTQMIARSLFESDQDLRFNASVLVRMIAENARISGADCPKGLWPALALSGATELDRTGAPLAIQQRNELRFSLDALLRVLLWVPAARAVQAEWAPVLEEVGEDSLFATLARLPMHPTELVARHAGELLRAVGRVSHSRRWFKLSIDVSAANPGTVGRFGAFTRRLADEPGFFGDGPPGSLLNPTFEYR